MIRSFKHKGLKAFYETGSTAGIQASHARRLRVLLTALSAAGKPEDMAVMPSFRLHPLKGGTGR